MTGLNTYYRRHLPHYHPEGATFHVVFRLAGSLPVSIIEELRMEREEFERELKSIKNVRERKRKQDDFRQQYFERFDALLDGNSSGPMWLRQPEIAAIVQEALHRRDGEAYDLLAYCIMPNHVHLVVSRLAEPTGRVSDPSYSLSEILGSLKKYTALRANRMLGRRGAFWQDESYDHVIRDGKELEQTIFYLINNPVKAGLVLSWEQWQWTYLPAGQAGVKPGL